MPITAKHTFVKAHFALSFIYYRIFSVFLFFMLLNIDMMYVMAGYTLEELWKVQQIPSCMDHEAGRHILPLRA